MIDPSSAAACSHRSTAGGKSLHGEHIVATTRFCFLDPVLFHGVITTCLEIFKLNLTLGIGRQDFPMLSGLSRAELFVLQTGREFGAQHLQHLVEMVSVSALAEKISYLIWPL